LDLLYLSLSPSLSSLVKKVNPGSWNWDWEIVICDSNKTFIPKWFIASKLVPYFQTGGFFRSKGLCPTLFY
jgi:hypothetical protein